MGFGLAGVLVATGCVFTRGLAGVVFGTVVCFTTGFGLLFTTGASSASFSSPVIFSYAGGAGAACDCSGGE